MRNTVTSITPGAFSLRRNICGATISLTALRTFYVCGRVVSIVRAWKLRPRRIARKGELVPWRKGPKVGFIDASGKFKIEPTFDEALPFSEGMAAVKVGDQWGFVDPSGRMAIAPRFTLAFYFYDGLAHVETASGAVLIDSKGTVVTSAFEPALDVADGRVPLRQGDHLGFMDLHGHEVVPPIYDAIDGGFTGGLASVSRDGNWGYIDRNGKVVIPFQFDEAGSFYNGRFATARIGKQSGFINRSGRQILLPNRRSVGFLYGAVAPFSADDGRWGYVNESGKTIWGPEIDGPSHWPLLGWSDEDKIKSCEGFPESVRSLAAGFPQIGE